LLTFLDDASPPNVKSFACEAVKILAIRFGRRYFLLLRA
jgi:hypothetical protein